MDIFYGQREEELYAEAGRPPGWSPAIEEALEDFTYDMCSYNNDNNNNDDGNTRMSNTNDHCNNIIVTNPR